MNELSNSPAADSVDTSASQDQVQADIAPASDAGATAVPFTGELDGVITEAKAAVLLSQLRVMESLGGSAGFAKWLQQTRNGAIPPPPPPTSLELFADSPTARYRPGNARHAVTVSIWFAAAYFTLEVNVINTSVSGNGSAWGVGVGYIGGVGTLEVTGPLDRLRHVTGFAIFAGSGVAGTGGIMFYTGGSSGTPIAAIILAGAGVGGGVGGGGQFRFSGF